MQDTKNWRIVTLITGQAFIGQIKSTGERTVVEPAYTFLSNTQAGAQGFGHFEIAIPIQLRDGLKRVEARSEHIAFEIPITDEEWLKGLIEQADKITKQLSEAVQTRPQPQGNGGPSRIVVPGMVPPGPQRR